MTEATDRQIETLTAMKLPELRARYAEVLGTETKCPNKTWIARQIVAAMETQAAAKASSVEPVGAHVDADALDAPSHDAGPDAITADADADQDAPADAAETRLSKLSIDALRALHLELIGRPTSSVLPRYIIYRIREAQKGRVTTGPLTTRGTDGEPVDFKVLPLRMEASLVTQLDGARERLGLKTRMELFRRALAAYLGEQGEAEVAALFPQAE